MMDRDDSVSNINGRLRPRKSFVSNDQHNKIIRKPDHKTANDKTTKISTSKLIHKNETAAKTNLRSQHFLCPYCDKGFSIKQSLSKHVKRSHVSTNINCQICSHTEDNINELFKHMIELHPNQYFACLQCKIRFSSTSELSDHKLNTCEKKKNNYMRPYRSKLRSINKQKSVDDVKNKLSDNVEFINGREFNGIVISCELKPTHVQDTADIEDNITTNLILPPCKNIVNSTVIEKNAVIVLDNIQWNKKIAPNFSLHNNDTDQILSRLGVVHRSPRTETTRRESHRHIEDTKFEKCFDTSFYSKVASNVQENLTKYLDGSFNRLNPHADNIIKTRKAKNCVVINTVEGFPILLASEQYSRNAFDIYLPRMIAPKHKWKWDNNDDKQSFAIQDQFNGDSHTNNCIITLVSRLDIWTQLCMRHKFEDKFNITSVNAKKTEKLNIIGKELKEILESREIPNTSKQIDKTVNKSVQPTNRNDFPAYLGLMPSAPNFEVQPAILSGEWVRPRRYVCCACGEQTQDSKALSAHIANQHPNAQVAHYEIVGEPLLNDDILKHLYIPPSQSSNRTRPLRGSRECTKCKKPVSLEDLHQHMLECAGDTPIVRRKCRYRPFGVRRRRPRLPDNTIRKKIRKNIRGRQTRQKNNLRSRTRIRSEVGDAETIRRMIADLPAKRQRVTINPVNTIRSQKNLEKPRSKLRSGRQTTEDLKNRKTRNGEKFEVPVKQSDDKQVIKSKKFFPKPKGTRVKRSISQQESENKKQSKGNTFIQLEQDEDIKPKDSENITECIKPCETLINNNKNVNEQISTNSDSNRMYINSGTSNGKECSSRESYDRRDTWRSGCNNDKGNEFSKNPSTPQKVPLKHSIERLTSQTETNDRSVRYQQHFLMKSDYMMNYIQNPQYRPVVPQQFFENEAIVTKLDKPPLHNMYKATDSFAMQKSKLNKPRKGLNACIAMLKNKLVEPIPNTSTCQEIMSTVSISPTKTHNEKDTNNKVIHDSIVQKIQPDVNKVILPAHIGTRECVMFPLDLSGKSQNDETGKRSNEDEATNLCTKENIAEPFIKSKEEYTTLDLSNKCTKETAEKLNQVTTEKNDPNANVSSGTVETTLDLSIKSTPISTECVNKTLDLSGKTSKDNDSVSIDLSTKSTPNTNDNSIIKNPSDISSTKINQIAVEKITPQKPVYDPTLKIPQYKIRASGSTENNAKEPEKEPTTQPESNANTHIDLLPKEIVDILGTMPVQHRNTLLNVLPQVFAKTVKQLKLVVDCSTGKDAATTTNRSEIATQTSSTSLEPTCPPEFLNIDTDKYLIDPCTGAITERSLKDNEYPEMPVPPEDKIIDLTSDEQSVSIIQESSELHLKKVIESQGALIANSNKNTNDNQKPLQGTDYAKQKIPMKIANDQTASLRAVRIKSSNEKQKSLPLDNNHINVNLNNVGPKSDLICNLTCEDVGKEGTEHSGITPTLAIQQAEVSSTQQNNCNNNLQLNVIPTITLCEKNQNTNKLENLCEDNSEHKADINVINLQDKKLVNNVEDLPNKEANFSTESTIHNIEEINVTKSIPASKTEQQDLQLDCSITETDVITKNSAIVSEVVNDSLPDILTLNKMPLESSTPKQTLSNYSENIFEQSNTLHSDDDSEDDVSLALIVKQKQIENTSSQATFLNTNTKTKKLCSRKEKRKKDHLKINSNSNGKDAQQGLRDLEKQRKRKPKKNKGKNIVVPNIEGETLVDIKISHIVEKNLKVKDNEENSKIDIYEDDKKHHKPTDDGNIACNSESDIDKIEHCYKSNENLPSTVHQLKTVCFGNDNSPSKDKKIDQVDHVEIQKVPENRNDLDVVIHETQYPSQMDNAIHKEINDVKEEFENGEDKKKLKKKRGRQRMNRDISEEHNTAVIENSKINLDENVSNLSVTAQSNIALNDNFSSTEISKEENLEENVITTCVAFENDDKINIKKVKKSIRRNTDISDEDVNSMSLETKQPLRRSRRGKSLHLDASIDAEVVINKPSDIHLYENKIPLTKKQLIFSKLLLDEGNFSKDNVENSKTHTVPSIDNHDLKNNLHEIKDIGLPKVFNKPSKRKNSPLASQKPKKKKSLDFLSVCGEFNMNRDKSIPKNCQNHMLGEVEAIMNSENMDNNETSFITGSSKLISSAKKIKHNATVTELPNNSNENQCNKINEQYDKNDNFRFAKYIVPVTTGNNVNMELNNDDEKVTTIVETSCNYSELSTLSKVKSSSALEKRKGNNSTSSSECSQSSKPKKLKINIVQSKEKYDEKDHYELCKKVTFGKKSVQRRTRSKSVSLSKSANIILNHTSEDVDDPDPPVMNEPDSVVDSTSSLIHLSNTSLISSPTVKEAKDILPTIPTCSDQENLTIFNGNSNDSNDSSKSDIPLQKYLEDNSKTDTQMFDSGINISVNEKEIYDKLNNKNSRRTLGVCNNMEHVNDITEEQLKSEQFMESFGFFSERKPRKSNLLATKKISETFHIIANESDDMFLTSKERSAKKLQNENKKSILQKSDDEDNSNNSKTLQTPHRKKTSKRGRKKKQHDKDMPFCSICQKEFRRRDNLYRHQMTLFHISKLSEIELKFETVPYIEEPNLLVKYRKQVEKLKKLTDQIKNKKKQSVDKTTPQNTDTSDVPSLAEVIPMNDTNKEDDLNDPNVSRRGLSCDEALFLDCCELLKESHKNDSSNTTETGNTINATNKEFLMKSYMCSVSTEISQQETIEKTDDKSDGDVDSITAKTILESEEVRNLENDLISGLKKAVSLTGTTNDNYHKADPKDYDDIDETSKLMPVSKIITSPSPQTEETYKLSKDEIKVKKNMDVIEKIDIFEDKFDKIKRKSRSQAVAAKNLQPILEEKRSLKGKKKTEKRPKKKRNPKKNMPGTVLTKGALKGFDGIKVSIPTSDINISAIVPSLPDNTLLKKKRKRCAKKRKEKNKSLIHSHYANEQKGKVVIPPKQIDVYEFMDNEDTDMFDFRSSTRIERFKSPHKENTISKPSHSSTFKESEDSRNSSASCSDGDDFVYMSDDYICSPDETENSIISCELGKGGGDAKKTMSYIRRKDTTEKSAVMGKIFKHNAVRNDKKVSMKNKECKSSKANLDQLFDSLLENRPSTSAERSSMSKAVNESANDETISMSIMNENKHIVEDKDILENNSDNETGVARHRARRKCTVGKQNVLAETWSSESEPDVANSARPNSVDSIATVAGRKKKTKKSSTQHLNVRRNRHITFKTDHIESRVTGSVRTKNALKDKRARSERSSSSAEDESGQGDSHILIEQHGWIVGDSHKKLVTMLAHAKGRKRDDKRPLVE